MTGVRKPTRILALPVLRRKWLYAVEEAVEDLEKLPSWRTGRTLAEKAQLGQAELVQEVHLRILQQWEGLKAAPAGSIRNRLYRLAQGVIDREDVSETFLKGLPSATDRYDVIYPGDLPERVVRRRLRLFLRQQEYYNKCRLISYGVAAVPMVPLMVLPFPNIPLYYAGYKAYSHNRALRGCRQLLASMQDSGGTSAAASSQGTHALAEAAPDDASTAKETPHSTAAGSSLDATGEASGAGQSERPALVHLMSDEELVRIVRTHQRAPQEPAIDEEAAQSIGQRFGFESLPKLLSRMLKGLPKQT